MNSISCPLSTDFTSFHKFHKEYFHFHLVWTLFHFENFSLIHDLFRHVVYIPIFWGLPTISLLFISSVTSPWPESTHSMIFILLNLLRCSLWWSVLYVSLRRMSRLLWLDEILYNCQLDPDDDNAFQFNYIFTDFLPTRSINYYCRGVEVSNHNSKCVLISSFSFNWFCLMYSDTLL